MLEPGETWQFNPVVRNRSCSVEALGVGADITLNPGSTGPVVITNGAASFGAIGGGTAVPSALPVEFAVDSAAVCGEDVIFDMGDITSAGGGPFSGMTSLLTIPVGENVYTTLMLEDFAGGIPADWTVNHSGTATGAAETWTTDNPGSRTLALTEPFAIVDSDAAGSGVTHDEELISPPVDCTGYEAVELRFRHDFNWYTGSTDEQCDVDIRSSATGGAWVNVANFSGVDTSGSVTIDISAQAVDQTDVEVRFHYYDASYDYWWAVDDVEFAGGTLACSDYTEIFVDGFEADNTDAWSATTQ